MYKWIIININKIQNLFYLGAILQVFIVYYMLQYFFDFLYNNDVDLYPHNKNVFILYLNISIYYFLINYI